MKNLIKIGKFFLIIFIATAIFDLLALAYVYFQCSRAMDDTLSSIALMVAEENCIDSTTENEKDSKLYAVKKLMAENAPLWLTYNNDKPTSTKYDIPSSQVENPTTVVGGVVPLSEAIENIECSTLTTGEGSFLALRLSSSSEDITNNAIYYSYADCPNRGENITITLSANINVRLLMFGNPHFNQQIPISKQVTVVGMKFYKGKGDTEG